MSCRLFVEGEGCNAKDAERYQEILKMHFTSYAIFVISDYIPCLSFITRLQGTRERMQNIADTIHKKLDEILDLEGREQRRKNLNEEEEANCEKDFVDLLLETPSHDGVGTLDHVTIRAVVLVRTQMLVSVSFDGLTKYSPCINTNRLIIAV